MGIPQLYPSEVLPVLHSLELVVVPQVPRSGIRGPRAWGAIALSISLLALENL